MAWPYQLVPKTPAADYEAPDAPDGPVLRLVCGWDEKTNDYLYRDDVKNPPPLFGDGPKRAPKHNRVNLLSKPTNTSARGKERMESRRRARVARRASPLQQSTPNEIHVDEPLYDVPKDLQGTIRAMPKPVNTQDIQWEEMEITAVPLLNDPTVQIHDFDDIMVTLVSSENKRAHNEPAKVLDCRRHPNGTYFLLVSWYFDRSGLLKRVVEVSFFILYYGTVLLLQLSPERALPPNPMSEIGDMTPPTFSPPYRRRGYTGIAAAEALSTKLSTDSVGLTFLCCSKVSSVGFTLARHSLKLDYYCIKRPCLDQHDITQHEWKQARQMIKQLHYKIYLKDIVREEVPSVSLRDLITTQNHRSSQGPYTKSHRHSICAIRPKHIPPFVKNRLQGPWDGDRSKKIMTTIAQEAVDELAKFMKPRPSTGISTALVLFITSLLAAQGHGPGPRTKVPTPHNQILSADCLGYPVAAGRHKALEFFHSIAPIMQSIWRGKPGHGTDLARAGTNGGVYAGNASRPVSEPSRSSSDIWLVFDLDGTTVTSADVIKKSSAEVAGDDVLLGPPGVGKTLTTEVLSEHLQKPLYSVWLDTILPYRSPRASWARVQKALRRAFQVSSNALQDGKLFSYLMMRIFT
ncbi:hypothetical protein V500_00733 [Pseudogymnoascus sp. VKM F-4518 (FW-2643)]|nr:hypothetical protein V500_00733 [Pseudogymnoascus sp. VKM F-4518 (FW-2643)]